MGIKSEELQTFIITKAPPSTTHLEYWANILNFFEQNVNHLNIQDMEIICNESERCREYCNKNKKETITIFKNGHEIQQDLIRKGLNITKDKINPKIYDHLEMMKAIEIEEEEEAIYSTNTNNSSKYEEILPLAAAPPK